MSTAIRHWLLPMLVAAAVPCTVGADGFPASPFPPPCVDLSAIPRNVTVEDSYLQSLTTEMARRSLTFKQQLLVLGAAPSLRARLRNTNRINSTIALARTTFGVSKTGLLVADIEIPVALIFSRRDVEFIAHEMEHVIEQVEGINLAALAEKKGSGVYRVDMPGRPFETKRAKVAGQIVDREFRESSDLFSPCETLEADAGS
jgi:hypothetical protein